MNRRHLCAAAPSAFLVLAWCGGASAQEITWQCIQLDDAFRSEGVAAADVNRDGRLDVLAGDVWYEAPASDDPAADWTMHPVREVGEYNPRGGYSQSFANFVEDLNGDGWPDLILVGFPGEPAHWYANPGEGVDADDAPLWRAHEIWRSACNESPCYEDVTGDGRRELVMGIQPEAQMAWLRPSDDPQSTWELHPLSQPGSPGTDRFSHGLGVGDVNGDGRNDVVIPQGWWEQPEEDDGEPWTFHAANLGEAQADMVVYDFDGDGDNDILGSSAHAYGIWWYEHTQAAGGPEFTQHTITDDFSQTHSLEMADINGDGLMDFVTGKRWYAHNGNDPGEEEPVVLYWYELQRSDDGPRWERHLIHEGAGVGTQFIILDMNGDGLLDVVTSNKRGVHVFLQER